VRLRGRQDRGGLQLYRARKAVIFPSGHVGDLLYQRRADVGAACLSQVRLDAAGGLGVLRRLANQGTAP